MPFRNQKILMYLFLLILIVISLFSCRDIANKADEKRIDMNVLAGFEGYYKSEIPIPVTIEITNGEDKTFDGRIVISSRRWVPRSTYARDVHLEPLEKRTYDMMVYEGVARDIIGRLININLTVNLLDKRNRTVTAKTVLIKPLWTEVDTLILSISSEPNNFNFLESEESIGLKQFKASLDPNFSTSFPERQFDILRIKVVKSAHPMLSRDLRAWKALSSVFIDLESYIRLDDEFKKRLSSWVRLGGDLLLYPPSKGINGETINQLRNDPLIDFIDWNIVESEEVISSNKDLLLKEGSKRFLKPGNPLRHVNGYVIPPVRYPLVYSAVQDSGTVTLLCFNPQYINESKASKWIDLFFQLGLLTPTPEEYKPIRQFHTGFFERSGRGEHVPSEDYQELRSRLSSLYRFSMTYLLPIFLIGILAFIFYRSGRKSIFLFRVLPFLIIVSLLLPVMVIRIKFGKRNFEAVHFMYSTTQGMPSNLDSIFMIRKCFPEIGSLKINAGNDSMVFDEYVSGNNRSVADIMVLEGQNGYLLSNEKTYEPFRVIITESEIDNGNLVDGTVSELPDGSWKYEITNHSSYHLTNCEIFPFDVLIKSPRMVDDIPPKATIKGMITGARDNNEIDNERIDKFVRNLPQSIFDHKLITELIYGLEALAVSSSYKIYHDAHQNSDSLIFFAWTDDFQSGLKVCDSPARGTEVALVIARLKITPAGRKPLLKIINIEKLIETQPNRTPDQY